MARQRPRDSREGGSLEREHQEHHLPARGRGELSRRLRGGGEGGPHQLEFVPGVSWDPKRRKHPAHRRPRFHLGKPEVQQSTNSPISAPRAARFPSIIPRRGPGSDRYTVVVSLNGQYGDWQKLSEEEYEREKQRLIDESVAALEKYIPGVRAKIDWMEAATPRTIERYTTHASGTSFGTKFEGLKVSMDLPEKLPGLFHAGSVGIIMSGWLGTINYGVIVANKIDKALFALKRRTVAVRLREPTAVSSTRTARSTRYFPMPKSPT